jgi:hypothetical protein
VTDAPALTGLGRLLGWHAVLSAPAMHDVAYFIGGALSVDDCRARERDLRAVDRTALAASWGPAIDHAAAWLDYHCHHIHPFLWAVTPPAKQSPTGRLKWRSVTRGDP